MGSLAACRRLRRAWHYQDTLLGRATCSLRAQEPPARRSVSDARTTSHGRLPEDGLTLSDFLRGPMDLNATPATASGLPSPTSAPRSPSRSVFIETYGCQMNVNDTGEARTDVLRETLPARHPAQAPAARRDATGHRARPPSLRAEVVRAILRDAGYTETRDELGADVVLINTCAIRESAEERVWGRLASLRGRVSGKGSRGDSPRRGTTDASTAAPSVGADGHFNQRGVGATGGRGRGPVVGLLGCMAERLRERVLDREKLVDVVVGPDAYRWAARLVRVAGWQLRHWRGQRTACVPWQGPPAFAGCGQRAAGGASPRGRERAAELGRDLCRRGAGAGGIERGRVRVHHTGLQQHVRLLRGALHSRPRAIATRAEVGEAGSQLPAATVLALLCWQATWATNGPLIPAAYWTRCGLCPTRDTRR